MWSWVFPWNLMYFPMMRFNEFQFARQLSMMDDCLFSVLAKGELIGTNSKREEKSLLFW